MTINSKELQRLAVLVNKTVHSIEFPEEFQFDAHVGSTLRFLDSMDAKYANDEMLTSIRSAVVGIPQNKLQFFKAAHDLFAKINDSDDDEETDKDLGFIVMSPVLAGVPNQMSL